MSDQTFSIHLKSLETQIAVLKARMKGPEKARRKSFGQLYGMLAGKATSREQEIEAAEYQLKWSGKPEGKAVPHEKD